MTIIDLSFMLAPVEDKHAWRDLAVCAQVDPELFFPEKGGNVKPAKLLCGMCEVRDECLQAALDNNEQFGIFGGLSPKERAPLMRERREQIGPLLKVCKGCGEEFQPYRTRMVYCSLTCKHESEKANRKRHSRECLSCGRGFVGVADYCSLACRKKASRIDLGAAARNFDHVCRYCGVDFISTHPKSKYCTNTCRHKAINAQRRERTRLKREAS